MLLVGCGNMAGAMVAGWRRAGLDLTDWIAVRPSGRPVEGLEVVTELPDRAPPLVMLAVKPQKLDLVTPSLAPLIGDGTTLISLLAGVEVASLRRRFPKAAAIVRAMPNLPVSEGQGVVALFGDESATVDSLMGALGLAVRTETEPALGTIGSVAGSGPAYVARFVEALAKAGVERGLDPALADRIALQTLVGTGVMAEASGETMDALVARVRSPNGTTQAGLTVLEAEIGDLMSRTIAAATRRGEELAAAARD